MRKANVAALIIGGVSTCVFGGIFSIYTTAPVVKSVTPNNNVENIYEVENEELSNVAAVTSIKTTPQTTTTNTDIVTWTTTSVENMAQFTVRDVTTAVDVSFTANSVSPSYMSNYVEAPTEIPTESYTIPDTSEYIEELPAQSETVAWNEPETDEELTEASTSEVEVIDSWTNTEVTTENVTETPVEEPTEPEYFDISVSISPNENTNSLPISDEEYVILCNAVAHEAGSNWISTYDKALVAEVIMNRVYSPLFPNTIVDVLTQTYQFTGSESYVYLGDYASYVTQDVKDAVSLYFSDQASFSHGYYSFYGDGRRNYFY